MHISSVLDIGGDGGEVIRSRGANARPLTRELFESQMTAGGWHDRCDMVMPIVMDMCMTIRICQAGKVNNNDVGVRREG